MLGRRSQNCLRTVQDVIPEGPVVHDRKTMASKMVAYPAYTRPMTIRTTSTISSVPTIPLGP